MTSSFITLAAWFYSVIYALQCFNMGAHCGHLLSAYQACARSIVDVKKELKCVLNERDSALQQIAQK
ncbi:hypothetical protein MNL01_07355 [Bartonella krasnovii]|uniref:hypothetical protein n=1 Tax=Bartonella krasnovii TaxID=2267275 RepID=UPI001F4C8232|nr:hypothetical protein [Bartonella krasnovii]UNF53444.1 hypothetical protein MNL01_07355 [Bartonella krasnovii]